MADFVAKVFLHFAKYQESNTELTIQATAANTLPTVAQWQVIPEPMLVAAVPILAPRERTPGQPARGYSAS
jgi:hypothetical protein